jgi:hypothetical protein
MILYHGGSAVVKTPNLELSRKSLDFGSGFYTTVNKDQAVEFAGKVALRKKEKNSFVNVYDFDEESAKPVIDILSFSSPDRSWLDFVHQNRSGIYAGKPYDLIIGPVANDDVYATLLIYEQGILNIEQTIEALKVKKLYNQYVFKTEKALSFLKFNDSFKPEAAL